MKPERGRIDNWGIFPYPAKNCNNKYCIYGVSTDPDIAFFRSSPIVLLDIENGRVETENSIYSLGTPNYKAAANMMFQSIYGVKKSQYGAEE